MRMLPGIWFDAREAGGSTAVSWPLPFSRAPTLRTEMPDLCALGSGWGKRAVVPVCSEVENAVQIQVQSPKAQHRDGWRPSQQLPFALCAVSFQACLVKGLDLLGEAQG